MVFPKKITTDGGVFLVFPDRKQFVGTSLKNHIFGPMLYNIIHFTSINTDS